MNLRNHHAQARTPLHHDDLQPAFGGLGKLIGDVPAATAILDRIRQNAEIIQVTGKSYRLRGKVAKSSEEFSK